MESLSNLPLSVKEVPKPLGLFLPEETKACSKEPLVVFGGSLCHPDNFSDDPKGLLILGETEFKF